MARVLGHRQTKGAATDKPDLLPPRYIPTLPFAHCRIFESGRSAAILLTSLVEIGQRSLNAGVAPAPIVLRHAHDQL
jgi:hypothetical protein